jgi:hypothetical protein
MSHSGSLKVLTVCIFGMVLSACATENYTSEMYQENFGRMQLNSGDPLDTQSLQNGLYAPRFSTVNPSAANPYALACLTADYRCAHQQQETAP